MEHSNAQESQQEWADFVGSVAQNSAQFLLLMQGVCEGLSAAYAQAARECCAVSVHLDAARWRASWPRIAYLLNPWLDGMLPETLPDTLPEQQETQP